MKKHKVQQLEHGVYRIFWKEGGTSVAAIGSKTNGDRWICPSNWTGQKGRATDTTDRATWENVKSVDLIALQHED